MMRSRRSQARFRLQGRTLLVAAILAGAALAALSAGLLHPDKGPERIQIPTSLESTGLPSTQTLTAKGLPVTVAPSAVAFGPVRPGHASAPVELKVRNAGGLPIAFVPEADPMVDPASGVALPADAIQFLASPTAQAPLAGPITVAPGETASVWVRLHVPSGSTMYVPAGAYAGSIGLVLEEVRA